MSRGSYGGAHPDVGAGGVVAVVTPESPAARAGISAGETLLAVDGAPLRDVIDWQWLTASDSFEVAVLGADGCVRGVSVERSWDEVPGVEFSSCLFDGVRECENACEFCFVAQLPTGLRASLYVRDDDYRLSFLSGNFVTLTNLADADVERIIEQRLSPLYVSLHAVDEDVRRRLIRATHDDLAPQRADELLSAGIELHAQVVLVPGANDGAVLERTLAWLAARPLVDSVGVVPVGLTGHQRRYSAAFGDSGAARVLDALEPWRTRMVEERGLSWVHAADEMYLAAGRALPPSEHYDGFPQYENGIGLVRVFLDAWLAGSAGAGTVGPAPAGRLTLVTGELFAPTLRELVADSSPRGLGARVLAVPNRFFGGNVSVAGLLTAADIAAAVVSDGAAGTYLIPDVVLNTEGVTLDDVAEGALAALCGADLRVVSSDAAEFLAASGGLSGEHTG